MEMELAAEKEKSRRLELELAKGKEQILKEYRSSREFEELLNAEYDANFPATFNMCWEKIIEELGQKISGVTLAKFPAPAIPGASSSTQETVCETVAQFSTQPASDSQPLPSQEGVSSPMVEDLETFPVADDPAFTHSTDVGDSLKDLDI